MGLQVDFKRAFLNGRLDKPVYMSQPLGYKDAAHPAWPARSGAPSAV